MSERVQEKEKKKALALMEEGEKTLTVVKSFFFPSLKRESFRSGVRSCSVLNLLFTRGFLCHMRARTRVCLDRSHARFGFDCSCQICQGNFDRFIRFRPLNPGTG